MQLHLTDGTSKFSFTIAEDEDREDCIRIRASKRPVRVALKVIQRRIGDASKGLYPIADNPITGLRIEQAA